MNNPNNNFGNFFNMDEEIDPTLIEQYRPSLSDVIRSLIELTSTNPMFYKNANLRMAVCAGVLYATQELGKCKEQGIQPKNVSVGDAAFMMLLGDMLSMTYDEFAGDLERQHFPHNRKNYEQDLEDDYGNG